jgi:extracellular elastinolytic metalloproteinase
MQSLVFLGLLGSSALAHPAASGANKNPWKPSLSKRLVDLDQFRPGTVASYINATETNSSPDTKLIKRDDYVATATELVKSKVPNVEFRVYDSYIGTNGIGHVYFRQTIFGLDVDNTDFNVNVSVNKWKEAENSELIEYNTDSLLDRKGWLNLLPRPQLLHRASASEQPLDKA